MFIMGTSKHGVAKSERQGTEKRRVFKIFSLEPPAQLFYKACDVFIH